MRDLFQMHTINLSVAVWVGFIALFGVATDDGVLMGTYIHHVFLEKDPQTRHAIREAVVTAGLKRVRPAAMTTATTLIALLPVLTSTGKGADIMVPDFRRHADPVDDHVCRPRIPMLVAGRAAEERGKGPQRSRKFLTRKINFPSHFLSFGLSG